MTNDGEDILFADVLSKALKDWPESIDCNHILFREDAQSESYTIENFGELADSISHAYIGQTDEVIMRAIHRSIRVTVHSAAKFCISIRPADLRDAAIKERFEDTLKHIKEKGSLNWQLKDIDLINQYFAANQV